MSRVLFVLIAVLVLAGAAFWLATPGRTSRGARATDAAPAVAAEPREEAALAVGEQPSADRAGGGEPTAPAPTAATPRREAASGREAELARGHWIEGRVLFPAGTPADEEVFVTANGKELEDGGHHRVAVARDGSFRVAFGEKTRTGRFELEARYLYLDHIERWKSTESDGKVVLAPQLGTRIVGRVRLPAGAEAASVGGRLELELARGAGASLDAARLHELSAGLEFHFDALPPARDPDLVYELSYDGEAFLGRAAKLVAEAGKTLEVELELRPGTVLSGSVRDEEG